MGPGDDKGPPCPTCKGSGWVVLLTSRPKCADCDGTGITAADFDDEPHDELEEEDTPPRGTRVP